MMEKTVKIGSLFDGSGGFPLAASLCGIDPVWASEIEPYPIAVTRSRFPKMKHLGDVSKVNGADVEPVDIVTFGSPCQDMSIAGKRAGLKHKDNGDDENTRSGLFMEAVRIIKEMREATNGEYPRFVLWENVPGAFSSNKGEDFRTVLEELIKIVEPSAIMPAVPKNGWPYADNYMGDGWSLAYRVFDAQYWGVPQRRRRIYLVADFRGQRAGEILFEREGVRGDFATFKTAGQGTAGDAADRTGADDCEGEGRCVAYSFDSLASNSMKSRNPYSGCRAVDVAKTLDTTDPNPSKNQGGIAVVEPVPYTLKIRSGCEGGGKGALIQRNMSATLATNNDQYLFQPIAFSQNQRDEVRDLKDKAGAIAAEPGMKQQTFIAVPNTLLEAAGFKSGQGAQARSIGWESEKCPTLAAEAGGNSVPSVCVKCYDARGNGDGQTVSTLTGDHQSRITDYTSVVVEKNPVYCLQGNGIDRADTACCNGKGWKEDTSYTLNTIDRPAVAYATDIGFFNSYENSSPNLLARGYKDQRLVTYPGGRVRYIVRRLTPTECARLQGFPDDWGHPDHKEDFTDEEYRFWLDVRNTYAAINGKPQKDYTKEQMLTWYNRLHTDSAEYKMWGNGIALPCALYCMQGIADAIRQR